MAHPRLITTVGPCLPFGPPAGDESLFTTDDGSSFAQFKLDIPCPFFGTLEDTLFVSIHV